MAYFATFRIFLKPIFNRKLSNANASNSKPREVDLTLGEFIGANII